MPPSEVTSLAAAARYLGRLAVLVRPYWSGLSKGIALGIVGGLLGLIPPIITRLFVDAMYPARDVTLLAVLVGGVSAVSVASSVIAAIRGYFGQIISSQLGSALSLLFFNHVQHLRVIFFDEHRIGEILSRFGDVRSSLATLTKLFETLLISGTYVLLVPPILFFMHWRLALLSMLSVPLNSAISVLSGRFLRRYWKRSAEAQAELNAMQVDTLSQIRTIKLVGAEHSIYLRIRAQLQVALHLQVVAGGIGSAVSLMQGLLKALTTGLCTWYGWTLILRGELTLGEYLAFAAYLGYLTSPIAEVTSLFADFQRTSVALGRMFEYLDATPEADPRTAYHPLPPIERPVKGMFELQSVSFSYTSGRRVLEDVSLRIAQGSVTAIVGQSGAGKSSLIRLLCRVDTPEAGRILLDGKPLDSFELRELRRQMAVVWQEFGIIRGTVWENLTIGIERPDRDRVTRAVQVCRLESTIAAMDRGYETPVAEWGASLSGGQRQRVALARALVRDAPILLLDEATANIDVQTETEILRDLFEYSKGKTIVFVTHRVATATSADMICVMGGGRVIGHGSHRQLSETSEQYRALQDAASRGPDGRQLRSKASVLVHN